jgi:hypothetical protein
MKKLFALLFTAAFLLTACEDDDPPIRPTAIVSEPAMVIRSIYPTTGASGTTVAIFGENFGATNSSNFVRFDWADAEVINVGHGMLQVRVPRNLPNGAYNISINADGKVANSPHMFRVVNTPDR